MKHSAKTIFSNWQVKVLCFIAAVFVYIVVAFGIQARRVITLPLEVVLPEGYAPTSVVPKEANLVFSGSEEAIYMFEVSNYSLKADFSRVDAEGVASVEIKIDDNNTTSYVDLSNVSIYTDPSFVKIYFEKSENGQN